MGMCNFPLGLPIVSVRSVAPSCFTLNISTLAGRPFHRAKAAAVVARGTIGDHQFRAAQKVHVSRDRPVHRWADLDEASSQGTSSPPLVVEALKADKDLQAVHRVDVAVQRDVSVLPDGNFGASPIALVDLTSLLDRVCAIEHSLKAMEDTLLCTSALSLLEAAVQTISAYAMS